MDYESTEYRNLVEDNSSPEAYYRNHDKQQINNLRILGTDDLRGKIIADIGCGGGSFLDLVKGYTQQTIAIEPAAAYHQALLQKGHLYYPYCQSALGEWHGKVDIVVSFAVVEHVENPLDFLKKIRELLKPRGKLLFSTPNYDDWLLEFLPEIYGRFFYRRVHKWYFNGESLKELAYRAGFSNVDIKYAHRFDVSNALLWIKDKIPAGYGKLELFHDLDEHYKKVLERKGRTDFIYSLYTK